MQCTRDEGEGLHSIFILGRLSQQTTSG